MTLPKSNNVHVVPPQSFAIGGHPTLVSPFIACFTSVAMETIVTDAMDRFQELEVWQTALLGTAVLFFMFICFGNFEPSAVRRAKVTRTHVFSSNIVMFFVLVVSVVVTGTLYFVGMTDAAFCGFIGVVVYFANSLVAGGAFLGIVFWGVGTLGTMHVMNANFGFQDMTSYFILFTVALVLAYPGMWGCAREAIT